MTCENERLLFPKVELVKKTIRERILTVTRFIYEHHAIYTYKNDPTETKIIIQDSYGRSDNDGMLVKLVVQVGSYTFQLGDTFNDNFAKENDVNGKIVGKESRVVLTVPVTFIVQAYTEEESSDVADELMLLIMFYCKKYYTANSIIPKTAHVSETGEFNRDQNIFQTTISTTMEIPFTLKYGESYEVIEQIYSEFVSTLSRVDPNYRAPGVTVIPQVEEKLIFDTFKYGQVNI